MERNFEKRVDPAILVPGARSVISVLLNYTPGERQRHPDAPKVSRYAYGRDYHFTIKEKLRKLFSFIKEEIFPGLEGRIFTDSAPVLDRAWAVRAGLGWIGKNTNLINKKWGSFVFIGEIISNLEVEPDTLQVKNACGNCTRCIDACPTGAITKPYTIDANKCISYLTIENKNEIPEEFTGKFDGWVFGCDICQEVCPWNKSPIPTSEPDFTPGNDFLGMTKKDWEELDEERFDELFIHTPLERIKHNGLRKNINFLFNHDPQKHMQP